jgi:ribosomal protein L40E
MPVCPQCGAENATSNRYCLSCGATLAAEAPLGDLIEAGIVCPSCETYNEPTAKSCTSCGQSLAGLTGFLNSVEEKRPPATGKTAPEVLAAAPAVPPPAKPSAAPPKPVTGRMPAATPPPPPSGTCPHCQARLPTGALACLVCGQRVAPEPEGLSADLSIRLRMVRGLGREDSTFPVGPAGVTVGRSKALIAIPTDPHLSPAHLTVRLVDGRLMLEDLGSFNGTFLRVRGQADLKAGAELIAGGQRLLLLGLGGPTTDVRTPLSNDTKAYGGPPPKQLFIAMRLLHASDDGKGRAGAVMLRAGPLVTIGQRGCSVNLSSDSQLAPCHLELHVRPTGVQLIETGGGGVFLRVRGSTPLKNGDEILAGTEVFRVEVG